MLFSPFTVKALVRLEFILILVLNVCSKQIEMRGQTVILYGKCNDGGCSNMRSFFFRPKSQLVRYPNRKTTGNNDKQSCVIVSATNEETPY